MLRFSLSTSKDRVSLISIKQYIIYCTLLISVYACQEDPGKLGLDFLKDSDLVEVGSIDTITVEAYTIEPEPLVTVGKYQMPIGSYVDPVFGAVKAELLAQFAYSYYIDFGDNPICDSLIIELFCSGGYGKDEFTSKISVYELTSDLADSIDYNSDFDVTGYYNINKINTSDPVVSDMNVDNDNTDSTLMKIYLNKFFANKLLNPPVEDDSLFYSNDSVFKANMKGLYFAVEQVSEDGRILYALPSNYSSRIILYYHNDKDTSEYSYYFYGSYVRIGVFNFNNHNEAGIPYINDESVQDTAIYLQSLGGTAANIRLPYINNLISELGNVSISKAELIVPVLTDSSEQTEYEIPSQLGLRTVNNEGEQSALPDDPSVLGLLGYFGGKYDDGIEAYRFNIGNYIQDLVEGTEYNYLRLFVGSYNESTMKISYNIEQANRVVLSSGNNANKKIKLNIYYTKIR
jgi:hypothetical protein